MDLSVLHDNEQAIALYEKLGFARVPVFAVKRKNPINERLFTGSARRADAPLNPYARIIVDEARRRGIGVEVARRRGRLLPPDPRRPLDPLPRVALRVHLRRRHVDLRRQARSPARWCAGRRRDRAGADRPAATPAARAAFLAEHGTRRRQAGARRAGPRHRRRPHRHRTRSSSAIAPRRAVSATEVLLEACFDGEDLRLVVIDYSVVAAAIRRPARSSATAARRLRALIETQSRRRAAATGGESRIPIDARDRALPRRRRPGARRRARPRAREIAVRKHRQPAHRRHHPRRHRRDPPGADRRGRRRRAGDRHPGHRHRPHGARPPPTRTTSSSRPTSAPASPTTSRSRPPSASSTCCSRTRCPQAAREAAR